MIQTRLTHCGLAFLFLWSVGLCAEPTSGWRGNQTGLWPEAKVLTEWSRIPRGAMEGLR